MSSTGENDNDLRKILDLTRFSSVVVLALHVYYQCYAAFKTWNLTAGLSDRILSAISGTGIFKTFHRPKWFCIILLAIGLVGIQGKKDQELDWKIVGAYLLIGAFLYFASALIFSIGNSIRTTALLYVATVGFGYLFLLKGGTQVTRIYQKISQDIFNEDNETFPQEERLLQNEYSVNFRAQYQLKKRQLQLD
jgi:hypothetical protein